MILVALLPLQTVFVRVEIAWKAWLFLLIAVVALELWETRGRPWSRPALLGLGVFLVATLASLPIPGAGSSSWRLWLALVAGGLLLLVTGKEAVRIDDVLKVVFWSGAVMAFTAVVVGLVTNGVFGGEAVSAINEIPLVFRVNKPAYLNSGFIAITNWHQDPGYAALWTNVWLVLSVFAWTRGAVKPPGWVGPVVVGGLMAASVLTFARTGWLGLIVAVGAVLYTHWRAGRPQLLRAFRVLALGAVVGMGLLGLQIAVDPPGVGGDVLAALEFRTTHFGDLGAIDLGEPGVVDPNLVVPDDRLDVWGEYWRRFAASPIRGIGLGTGWAEPGLQEPHNLWLELLAETGVVGTIGFLVLLGALWRRGGGVATSVLAVVFVASLSQTVLFEPVLWFGLGLWLAAPGGPEGLVRGPAAA